MVQSYYDNTGLYRKFGTDKATAKRAGEYHIYGDLHEIELNLNLVDVPVTDGGLILDDTSVLPKGARVEEIQIVVTTAATGSGAVLNLGTIQTDRTTEIDFNGLVAAIPLASIDTAGKKVTLNVGSTYVGAVVGTTTTLTGHFVADYDTAAFTAGAIRIRIRYYMP